MRQIILATQNYETQYGVFPPGVVNPYGPIRSVREEQHIGWTVQLLPFMEQNGLAQGIDTRLSAYDGRNGGIKGSVRSLLCPTEYGSATPGITNYAACHHDVEAPIDADNHGVFFLNSGVRRGDITDGLSYTIFYGEKLTDPNDLGWISGTRSSLRNTGTPINTTPDPTAQEDPEYVGGFGSNHPRGANFAFGDGSVRFISETIHPDVYRLLGHREDGELIRDLEF
jgi:prepilin-type processing-associated H-X9-DG protein